MAIEWPDILMQIAEMESEIQFYFKDKMVKKIVSIGSEVSILIFYLHLCWLDVQYGEEYIGSCLQGYFSNDLIIYFPKCCYCFGCTCKHFVVVIVPVDSLFLKERKKIAYFEIFFINSDPVL